MSLIFLYQISKIVLKGSEKINTNELNLEIKKVIVCGGLGMVSGAPLSASSNVDTQKY